MILTLVQIMGVMPRSSTTINLDFCVKIGKSCYDDNVIVVKSRDGKTLGHVDHLTAKALVNNECASLVYFFTGRGLLLIATAKIRWRSSQNTSARKNPFYISSVLYTLFLQGDNWRQYWCTPKQERNIDTLQCWCTCTLRETGDNGGWPKAMQENVRTS